VGGVVRGCGVLPVACPLSLFVVLCLLSLVHSCSSFFVHCSWLFAVGCCSFWVDVGRTVWHQWPLLGLD
jgi:hypothetical protein